MPNKVKIEPWKYGDDHIMICDSNGEQLLLMPVCPELFPRHDDYLILGSEAAKRVEALLFGMWQVLMERNPNHRELVMEMRAELSQLLGDD